MTRAISNKSHKLNGTIVVPGDKSVSHRALMFGAIANGETVVTGLLDSEDVKATRSALAKCGAVFYQDNDNNWRVKGVGEQGLSQDGGEMDMGNSGTSTRILMGLLSGYNVHAKLIGDDSLSKRPMRRVLVPLSKMGAKFKAKEDMTLPITLASTEKLKGITYELPVASAQVKSAILIAGLNAQGITTVIEKEPTRNHTETMLEEFGAKISIEHKDGADHISIEGGQTLKAARINVPADPSSAAFPMVAALLTRDSEITLKNVMINKTRNGLIETLREMGADIKYTTIGDKASDIVVKYSQLKGVDVPPERIPSMIDECPILAVAAANAVGTTRMTGLAELRVKESDRLGKIAADLKACGAELEEGEDWLTIHGTGKPLRGGVEIDPALDHRIAMSFLVLGLASELPVMVRNSDVMNTSFPGFIETMKFAGADVRLAQNA